MDPWDNIYFGRYADYQQRFVRNLQQRVHAPSPPQKRADNDLKQDVNENPEQAEAIATAGRQKLTLISGGPGTGKTTTVAKILLRLARDQLATAPDAAPLRLVLVAPTGKAAARLGEAIQAGVTRELTVLAQTAPQEAAALAYLQSLSRRPCTGLWASNPTPTRFRHNPDNPLSADVVLLDEASMVDLPLMTKLLEAVPSAARLLMLGDKDQLASVEVGSVFGDLFSIPTKNPSTVRGSGPAQKKLSLSRRQPPWGLCPGHPNRRRRQLRDHPRCG